MIKALTIASLFALPAAPVMAATWAVDSAKSTLGFSGTQTGEPFSGSFKAWTAAIEFDPAKPEAAHLVVTVDMASGATGDPQRDEALPTEDWFSTGQFPKATFEATGFTPKGGESYETSGKLSIRGISKDVSLPFTLTISNDAAHAVGHANLVRSAFGVGQGNWASDQYVAFAVDVAIDLTAKRAP